MEKKEGVETSLAGPTAGPTDAGGIFEQQPQLNGIERGREIDRRFNQAVDKLATEGRRREDIFFGLG